MLIRHILRMYAVIGGSALFTALIMVTVSNTWFFLLPLITALVTAMRVVPHHNDWYKESFIEINNDHFIYAAKRRIKFNQITKVEALPHKQTHFLVQLFMPYWPGSYKLAISLQGDQSLLLDLSPIDHKQRLQLFYLLEQHAEQYQTSLS